MMLCRTLITTNIPLKVCTVMVKKHYCDIVDGKWISTPTHAMKSFVGSRYSACRKGEETRNTGMDAQGSNEVVIMVMGRTNEANNDFSDLISYTLCQSE